MLRLRRSGARGLTRKTPPATGRRAGGGVSLVALAMLALSLEGCTMIRSVGSGSGCGPCGTRLRLPRFFQHNRAAAADCNGCNGELGAMPMEGSAPVIPAPATIGPVAPAADSEIPDLKPTNPAPTSGSTPSSGSSSGSSTTRSGYQTYRRARPLAPGGGGLARVLPRLEPAEGPAPGRVIASATPDPLDNLPAPEASTVAEPARRPDTAETTPAATVGVPASPPAESAPDEARPAGPAIAGAAPGIARFKVVEPQIAGGSFPTPGGWEWLAEKSYRTVLDLREPGQMGPNDLAEIAHRGLRYIALPVSAAGLDATLLARFDRELGQTDARPLYFCDADGTRPATLWFLHRVVTEKTDRRTARREAESLGRIDPTFDRAANALLETLAPPKAAAVAEPEVPATAVHADGPEPRAAETFEPATAEPLPAPAPVAMRDPAAWRPFGALLLAMLGVPLAFLGRSGLGRLHVKRASLPAPRRSPKSLPPASGA